MKSAVMAIALAAAIASVGCDKLKEKIGSADASAPTTSATSGASTPSAGSTGKKEEENLFSAGEGAMVVSLESQAPPRKTPIPPSLRVLVHSQRLPARSRTP